jgi:hypothetical protein
MVLGIYALILFVAALAIFVPAMRREGASLRFIVAAVALACLPLVTAAVVTTL